MTRMRWTCIGEAPTNDGGSPITGYKVQWKEAADSWDTPEDVSEETVTGTNHTIDGLTEGVEYTVRVMGTNQFGEGPASAGKNAVPRETRAPEVVRVQSGRGNPDSAVQRGSGRRVCATGGCLRCEGDVPVR